MSTAMIQPSTTLDSSLVLPAHLASEKDVAQWIDSMYREAQAAGTLAPWEPGGACPCLVAWLNALAPSLIRTGGRVAAVCCGYGHDAVELVNRGYEVCAIDASRTAIERAKELHPLHASCFSVENYLAPSLRHRHRFDFVVDTRAFGVTPPNFRRQLAEAMADMLGPHGVLLTIARGCDAHGGVQDAAPFCVSEGELDELFSQCGLTAIRGVDDFEDDCDPPVRRVRAAFRRT